MSEHSQSGRGGRGYTLIEVLLVAAIGGLIALMIAPRATLWGSGLRVRLAAGEVAAALSQARMYAIRHNRRVAVKFRTDDASGKVTMALYRDGNGNGVRNRDIDWRIDPEERPPRPLSQFDGEVRFGFPAGDPPREIDRRGGRISGLDDPIRFNGSDLASFSRNGTATPGTVYLTDGRRHLMAVRVSNRSGRITVWVYDREVERWQSSD